MLDRGAVRKAIASIFRAKQITDIALDLLTLRGTASHLNKNKNTYSIYTYMCAYAQQLNTPPSGGVRQQISGGVWRGNLSWSQGCFKPLRPPPQGSDGGSVTLRKLPPKNQKRCDFSDDCVNPNMIERVLRVRIVLGSRDRVFSGVGIGMGKQTLFGKTCHVVYVGRYI